MTDQEINIEIAKSLGYTLEKQKRTNWFLLKNPNGDCIGSVYKNTESVESVWLELWSDVPDFINDLNAMHSAVLCLDKTIRHRDTCLSDAFANELQELFSKSRTTPEWWSVFSLVNATARQRSEAYLKALGKWKD